MSGVSPREPGASVSDYEYDLPADRIARYPAERRDESRLLVVPRGTGTGDLRHLRFHDLIALTRPGDVLVVNDSRVIPARLLGRKPTGAPAEVLLLRPAADADPGDPRLWEALVRPGGKLKPGRRVEIAADLTVEVVDSTEGGGRLVRLEGPGPALAAIERHGHVPLPPYLDRDAEPLDRERYQTVYARTPGSVAAPTAGLHFTPALLEALAARGVARAEVTLEVGVGTFRPVEGDDPSEHPMHAERWRVSAEAAETINRARAGGGRCWAVGTTVVRTLETAVDEAGTVRAGTGETRLFVRPPYRFRAVDALVTNFHLPRSTLLMLVAAFAGYDRVMEAYGEAVREGYRFYSYGDAMAVVP